MMRRILQSLLFVEAALAVLGVWLFGLQASGIIAWPMQLTLAPLWIIGIVRGGWSALAAIFTFTVVFVHRVQLRENLQLRRQAKASRLSKARRQRA